MSNLIIGELVLGVTAWSIIVSVWAMGFSRRMTYRQIELWLMRLEDTARKTSTAESVVEIPGYQGVIRRFRQRFIQGLDGV